VEARPEHALAAAMRKIDLFVPLLTGDATIKAADIVGDIVGARAANTESMTEDQGLHPVIRESLITLNILVRLLLLKLIAFKPLEVAEFGKTVSHALLAATEAKGAIASSPARQGRAATARTRGLADEMAGPSIWTALARLATR